MRTSRGDKIFRVGIAQINTTVGAIDANLEKIFKAMSMSVTHEPDLLVFPEMTLTGYPPEDLLYNPTFIQKNLMALKDLSRRSRTIPIVVGFVDRSRSGKLFNAAAFIRGGRIESIYHKCELPNYGVFDERRYFAPGVKGGVIRYSQSLRIGLSICEDMWERGSFLYDRKFTDDLSLIVNISASPYHAGKHKSRIGLVRSLAKHAHKPVVYANLIGGQDELVFDGGSMIVGAGGTILSEAPLLKESMIWADLPCPKHVSRSKKVKLGSTPKVRSLSADEEIYHALVLGTRDYIEKNGFSKVIIGLSGGIDSALVASIACDALGGDRVLGITMPSRYTSRETLRDASILATNLGMECRTIGIEPIFKAYLETLKPHFGSAPVNITEENLQARIRGNILMAFSNKWGHLVLTTGNKSEMATGYCTLYGDMAGGFAVIKDVPKTLVFALAKYRNRMAGRRKWIPLSIIQRAPSAELRFDQRDQDSLPPYVTLDAILKSFVELDKDVSSISSKRFSAALVRKVVGLVYKSEYKRRQAPPGIKITPKAFGRDRRMPITHRFLPL